MKHRYISEKLFDVYNFRYNEVTSRIQFKNKSCSICEFNNLDDYNFNTIWIWLKGEFSGLSKSYLRDLLNSAIVPKVNPIKDYFEKLPPWDGKSDYIDLLSSTVKTTNDSYFNWIFKKWFVAMVACAIDPETTNQTILIFIGKQGVGKSTWIENILPKELCPYSSSGIIDPKDKDSRFKLSECILINMEEIGAMKRHEVERFKELITKSSISDRRPYGIFSENYLRRASFIGSTNNHNILADVTGNRRFLIIESIKFESTSNILLDLVYSQGYELYKSGFQYWFNSKDICKVNSENENYRQVSHEEVLLFKYFQKGNNKNSVYLNASEIVQFICKSEKKPIHTLSNIEMGKVLSSNGFKTKKIKGIKKYILNKKI